MFNWFKLPRGHSKVIGHKFLPSGVRVIEYTGDFTDIREEIQGLAIELMVADEWDAYNFTEEVFEEVRKIGERRKESEEILKCINFKLAPMEWGTEYIPEDSLDDVLIKYGMPY